MFIKFQIFCDNIKQKVIFNKIRRNIKDWLSSNIIADVIMTYHYNNPPELDSLYACLDLPNLNDLISSEVIINQSTLEKIPIEIRNCIEEIRSELNIERIEMKNYRNELDQTKIQIENSGEEYYGGVSIEKILDYGSIGTKIALEIIEKIEENKFKFKQDQYGNIIIELAHLKLIIIQKLKLLKKNKNKYDFEEYFHFTVNPLLQNENIFKNNQYILKNFFFE